jgi:hypothetical protein
MELMGCNVYNVVQDDPEGRKGISMFMWMENSHTTIKNEAPFEEMTI